MSLHRHAARIAVALFALWWSVTMGWCWLAFADLAAAPAWLARTQAVCFGSSLDGLPEPYGWVALVVGPSGMLIAFVVIFRQDMQAALSRMRMSVLGSVAIVAVLAATVAEGAFVAGRIQGGLALREAERAIPAAGEPMPIGWPRGSGRAPELGLVDQHGASVTLASLRGSIAVVTFAFAHCQTICPTLVARLKGAAAELPDDVEVLIVTLDPWRDTPAALPAIAREWRLGPRQRALSGPVDDVNRVLDAFLVARGRNPQTGEVAHPAMVAIIDADGRLAYRLSGPAIEWVGEAVARTRSR
ncbi:MAG: hypothetical protein A2138_14025 [Deltaproteobacteria bacterium RBG_16_71_12]|nr:MAG: hypothetical protein A2138_14025 [Deltaproteobacteria bacterium RBG_16_71_12]